MASHLIMWIKIILNLFGVIRKKYWYSHIWYANQEVLKKMKILTNDYCSNGLWKEVSAAKSLCLEIISMIINVILISAWNCMHLSERKIHKMPAKTNETARKNEHMHQKISKKQRCNISSRIFASISLLKLFWVNFCSLVTRSNTNRLIRTWWKNGS